MQSYDINELPDEIIGEIIAYFIDNKDYVSFTSTYERFYTSFLSKKRSEICESEVHHLLHTCINKVMEKRQENHIPSYIDNHGKSGDGIWQVIDDVRCTRYGVRHTIKCSYIEYSRDVNMLVSYIDDVLVQKFIF